MANRTQYRIGSTIQGRDLKKSDFGFWITNADGTAFSTDPTVNTSNGNKLIVAALALQQGTELERRMTGALIVTDAVAPTANDAIRSSKLALSMKDKVNGRLFTETIPCRDSSKYNLAPHSKDLLLSVAAGGTAATEALVVAVNTTALSVDGNSVTLISIKLAGRAVA